MKSVIIIPALNEQDAIGGVVRGVKHRVDRVIVVPTIDDEVSRARMSVIVGQ